MKKLKNLLKHAAVKNSLWIISERVVQMIISFILTMISARYLGPSNYGILSYGASFVTFFLTIIKLGLDSIIVKKLIEKPDEEGTLLGTAIVFRLISSFISIFLIFVCVIILKPGNKIILITTILQSIVLAFQAMTFLDYWYQAKLKSKYVSIAKIIGYLIATIYKIVLLITKANVIWFALSNVLDYFIICVLLFAFYKKSRGPKLKIEWGVGFSLLKESYHFIISSVMVVLYTQMDKIMIGSMIDEKSVGIYAAALSLHSAFSFLPEAIITSARPTLFSTQKNNKEHYLVRLKQTFALVFWLCVAFAFGVTIFSSLIINIVFGSEYSSAKVPLLVLVWAVPFSNLGNIRGIWIVGESKQKYVKKYLVFSSLLNFVLNLILISKFQICGAAIATLITEIFSGLIAPLIYKDTREISKIAVEGIFCRFYKKEAK